MYKYATLAAKAVEATAAFYTDKRGCEKAARQLLQRISAVLEASSGTVHFVRLDEKLAVASTDACPAPELVRLDRRWHFGVLIDFRHPGDPAFNKATLKFSIETTDTGYLIGHRRDFPVAFENPDFVPLIALITDCLAEDFSRPLDSSAPSIGFLR